MDRFEPVPSAEYLIQGAEGRRIAISASYTPIQLPGHPVWALVVMRDVTLRKRRERQWIHQAMTDPLTGLPNRTAFRKTCIKEFKRVARNPRPFAIAMIDIDGFKRYNDTAGHAAGDGLLKVLAGLIQVGRRANDLVARYGGDEFALLLPETDTAGAMVVAERLRSTVAKFPLVVLPSPGPLTISIGVAVYPDDGATPETLGAQADQRLYQAKRQGGDRVEGPG
jgi:diguanylate cyclase (GGDEF)-like protein